MRTLLPVLLCAALAAFWPSGLRAAPTSAAAFGTLTISGDSSTLAPNGVAFAHARLRAQNGATLRADELRADISNAAAGAHGLSDVVATGHVSAHFPDPATGRTYDATADRAVFDPTTNEIVMSGHVRAEVRSAATRGPIVETGSRAEIQLGPAPKFPVLTFDNPVMTFTPVTAGGASASHAAPAPERP